MGFEIKLSDNADEILKELQKNKEAALEAVGQQAESNTKNIITALGLYDTGRLRNSITHTTINKRGRTINYKVEKGKVLVDKEIDVQADENDKVIIGSAVFYAPHLEYGTKKGIKPKHFLRDAIANHQNEYKEIIEKYLKGNG